jgi:hypothetical protein
LKEKEKRILAQETKIIDLQEDQVQKLTQNETEHASLK